MKQDNFLTLQQDIDSLRATEPENTYLLYAMGLRLGTMDYYSLRLNNLLDGPDDKKVDFFHIDNDTGVCTIAQGYFSDDWTRRDPPAAKAWDLRVIDPIQRRLQSQFAEINISYQLRRSVARRRPNDVLFEKLAPFLSAFYGDPFSAHRNRPELLKMSGDIGSYSQTKVESGTCYLYIGLETRWPTQSRCFVIRW